ncbi:MAG: ABC transporter substrate-binding protein [Salinisphaera sp.]|jgi:branched-chain amino acid transport system substrate-binding protein|nr:ABC transporter substrate-binding protein [Salinisphaera sp.]
MKYSCKTLCQTAAVLGVSLASIYAGQVQAADSGPIKIGLIADLTGNAALSGRHKVNGAKLAVEQVNAHGGVSGRKLQLVVEDDRGSNQAGVSAYQKLASDTEIKVIIGSIRSTIVKATLPYITRYKIPTMIGGTNPGLTHEGNQWVFRFRPNDDYASKVMAKYSTNQMHAKKVAILYDTDAFGSAGNRLLQKALKADGAKVVSDQGYTTGTKDYTSYLTNIKSSGADTLETYMTDSEDEGQMLKQFSRMGLNMKFIGSASTATAVTIQLAGNAANGKYAVTGFVNSGNEAAKQFSAAYKKKYNDDADLYSAWVYDAVNVVAKVIGKDGNSTQKIQQGLRHDVKGYHGVIGVYDFDKKGDGLHGLNVVKIENGQVKVVKYVNFAKQQ